MHIDTSAPANDAGPLSSAPLWLPPARRGRKRPLTTWAPLFICFVSLALAALEAWSRFSARENLLRNSATSTVTIARAAGQNATNTLNLVDTVLWGLVERVEKGGAGTAELPRLHHFMSSRVERTPVIQGLFLYNENGRWIVNSLRTPFSGQNNADREYFIFHRDHDDRNMHIGHPLRSRSSGDWVLPVSRRINRPDGGFAGVVLATVKISYFQSVHESYQLGDKGVVLLAMHDGTIIARRPFNEGTTGSNLANGQVFGMLRYGSSGTAMLVSKLDRIERMYSYERLQSYPLVVAAALSKKEILKQWYVTTAVEAGAVGILLATLLSIGTKIFNQMILRDRTAQALRLSRAELEERNSTLRALATRDGLTGLSNRRHLDEQMAAEFVRAARERSSLALVMIDVDYFKRYNDSFGHAAGDTCLQTVAGAIAAACRRPADLAARFGGEEFVILLPNTGSEGAAGVADVVCSMIYEQAIGHTGSPLGRVTVSAGVFALVPKPGQSVRTLLESADRCLYQAKAAGRNRVGAAMPPALPVENAVAPAPPDALA
jgi:diguanylate cyclase (GGDEF)-like protein